MTEKNNAKTTTEAFNAKKLEKPVCPPNQTIHEPGILEYEIKAVKKFFKKLGF